MRRAICVLLGLIVACWTCGRVPSGNVVFEAQVTNAAGEPVTTGHVLVYDGENGSLLNIAKFKRGGRIRIEVSYPFRETRYVRVVSPYYQHLGFPFIVARGTSRVSGTVVLASNVRKDPDQVVVIIGDKSFEMERQPDGSFTYRFDEDTGEIVSYSLKGASVDGVLLPRSQRDRLSFAAEDGPPFYWAVIERPLWPVEFVYAPSELPEPDPSGSASRLVTSYPTLKAAVETAQELDHAVSEYARRTGNGEQPERREVMKGLFALALAGLSSESVELRQYSATIVMDGSLGDVATDEERARAAEAIPLLSPYWAWVRGLWSLPPERLGPRGFEVLESLARENADRRVRAFAVAALANAAKKAEDTTTWLECYERLERYVDLGEPIPYLLKRLDPKTRVSVGKRVPSFNLPLFDGTYRGSDFISDETFSGVAYVLVFWGTWCPPCVAAMPDLHSLWQRYGGPDLQIVSLSVGERAESVRRFRKELWSMPWLHVVLEGDLEQRVLEHFEVTSYPTTILVGRDGNIVSLKDADEGLVEDVTILFDNRPPTQE